MNDQKTPLEGDASIRVPQDVRRLLLTIQYRRKMLGESVSFGDIIKQALDGQEAAQ